MSKITFRADDDLISKLEEFDASKSEIMREALRTYLDNDSSSNTREVSFDQLVYDRVDDLVAERVDSTFTRPEPQDINVNITVDGESQASRDTESPQSSESRKTRTTTPETSSDTDRKQCSQCGEILSESHVYCPNCGEKASHRAFCDCGDEIRTDWSFCPGCGRRTPAADVLDRS